MKYLLSLACTATLLFAQTPATNKAVAVEHAVPFGTVTGKLLLLGNYVIFLDEQQPESSFVVPRASIESLNAEGPTITVQTREPIRNRTGDVRRLSFRVAAGGDPAAVTGWYATASPGSAPATTTNAGAAKSADSGTYQAKHDHRIGACTGRLLVGDQLLSYESIDNVNDSRRWEYKSIKEISHPNPYEIEIKPFEGGSYKLKLEGSGMDPAAFKQLVDRVTQARAGR
jgi:hypothetical protein